MEAYRNELIENGNSLGLMSASGSWSFANGATELIEGISCYDNLKKIFDKEDGISELLIFMKQLVKHLFVKESLILGITIPETDKNSNADLAEYGIIYLLKNMPTGFLGEYIMHVKLEQKNDVISIPATVSYATAAINLKPQNFYEIGKWQVAANIISMEYLWREIRMKQGAYGAGMSVDMSGNIKLYSFRDPSPADSIGIFKQCSNYLREFVESDVDLTSYIIGAISHTEPLMSPLDETALSEIEYLSGINYDKMCDIRKGMLETSKNDLRMIAAKLSELEKFYTTCQIKC